jgi:hypothetical protein
LICDQEEGKELNKKFEEEKKALEEKYNSLRKPLYEKVHSLYFLAPLFFLLLTPQRTSILKGAYEPTDAELACEMPVPTPTEGKSEPETPPVNIPAGSSLSYNNNNNNKTTTTTVILRTLYVPATDRMQTQRAFRTSGWMPSATMST